MRHSRFSPWSEQRLLARGHVGSSSEHHQRLDQAVESETAPQPAAGTANTLEQELNRMTKWGTKEVENVRPAASDRIKRFFMRGAARMIGKGDAVYDATTKEVSDAIDRQALQRLNIAEKELSNAETSSLGEVQTLDRRTRLSAGFLKQKSEVCAKLSADLRNELRESENRLNTAKHLRSLDKETLRHSVIALKEKLQTVKTIADTTNRALEGSLLGQVHHDVDTAVQYFTDACTAYTPDDLPNIRSDIERYIRGDKRPLEICMGDIADAMHPGRKDLAEKQIASMKRIAAKMTGEQSRWEMLKNACKTVAPTVGAFGAGLLTGGAGSALVLAGFAGNATLVTHGVRNWWRYGDVDLSKADYIKDQAASYFNSGVLDNLTKLNDLKEMDFKGRIGAIKDTKYFPAGTKLKVNIGSTGVTELTLGNVRSGARIARDTEDNTYAIDTEGDKNEYLVVIKRKNGFKETKKLNTTADSSQNYVLSIS